MNIEDLKKFDELCSRRKLVAISMYEVMGVLCINKNVEYVRLLDVPEFENACVISVHYDVAMRAFLFEVCRSDWPIVPEGCAAQIFRPEIRLAKVKLRKETEPC